MADKIYLLYICVTLLLTNALAAPIENPQTKNEQTKTPNLETSVSKQQEQQPQQQPEVSKQEQQPQQQPGAAAVAEPSGDKAAAQTQNKEEEAKSAVKVADEQHKNADDTLPSGKDEINIIEKVQHDLEENRGDKQAESVKKALPSEDALDDVQFKHLGPTGEVIPNGFYFFFAISVAAVFLILYRVFKLRVSRAERRYGVHGDRSTQELTPLPTSIEDVNSDDEDHTLFELNRQQIRIF